MARAIWKFPLRLTAEQDIVGRMGIRPLSVQSQRGTLTMWAEVDPDAMEAVFRVKILGTGHQFSEGSSLFDFVGTVQQDQFVWHVYIRTAVAKKP